MAHFEDSSRKSKFCFEEIDEWSFAKSAKGTDSSRMVKYRKKEKSRVIAFAGLEELFLKRVHRPSESEFSEFSISRSTPAARFCNGQNTSVHRG